MYYVGHIFSMLIKNQAKEREKHIWSTNVAKAIVWEEVFLTKEYKSQVQIWKDKVFRPSVLEKSDCLMKKERKKVLGKKN